MQGWRATSTPSTPPSCTAAPTDAEDYEPGHASTTTSTRNARRAFSVIDTEFGTSYGAYRPAEDDTYYWRIAHFLFPFYTMIPTGALGRRSCCIAYVPMDDDHTHDCRTQVKRRAAETGRQSTALPNGTGWYDRFHIDPEPGRTTTYRPRGADELARATPASPASAAAGHGRDRDMGTIYNRSREHLGTTDQLIIRTRRRMINAARRRCASTARRRPASTARSSTASARAASILPRNVDWWEGTSPCARRS